MGQMTPRSSEWAESAPVRIQATRDMRAEAAAVFAALADHDSWPRWFEQVSRVESIGDRPGGIGARRRVELEGNHVFEEEFVAWEPGRRWGFTILSSSLGGLRSGVELVTLERSGEGRCRVTYTMALDPKLPAVPILWFVRRGLRKNLEAALARLESYLRGERGDRHSNT
jgi:uncharacterized protein YndB with AHSA1/START domain